MDALFRFVVTHPVANAMTFAMLVVFGVVSYGNLPLELMPDVGYPTITVRTTYDGAAPAEVEDQVSRPIEESLATLDGLVRMESRSRADGSDVRLQFRWGTDLPGASQAIRESLQTAQLPDGAGRPLILRYDPALEPILRMSLGWDEGQGPKDADQSLARLREVADQVIARDLEGLEGVAAVRVVGGRERQVNVDVHEAWMAARRVRLEDVEGALASQNVNVAGGSILQGDVEYLVRTQGEYRDLDDVRDLKIRRADGALVPLTDVASVVEGHREQKMIVHDDAREAVELEVFKEADANVVDVANTVKGVIEGDGAEDEGLRGELPDGMALGLLDDQAKFVESAIDALISAAWQGGFLSIFVTFLFLRDYRTTGIIAAAIPLSVLIGFGPMYLLEVSLNLMSLGGLALGVGIVVDSATVVLESIQVHRDRGLNRREAAVKGTAEVALAVTASTLTSVATFAPIALVEGVAGELFGDLAVAIVASLLGAWLVALFLVPSLAALEWDETGDGPTTGVLGVLARRGSVRELLLELRATIVEPPRTALTEARAWMVGRLWRRVLWPYVGLRFVGQVVGRAVFVPMLLALGALAWVAWRVVTWVWSGFSRVSLWFADRFVTWYERQADRYGVLVQLSVSNPWTVLVFAFLLSATALFAGSRLGAELVPEVAQGRLRVEAELPIGTPLVVTERRIGDAERVIAKLPGVAAVHARIGADESVDAMSGGGEHAARLSVELLPDVDEERVIARLRDVMADAGIAARVSRPSMFSFDNPVEVVVTGWDLGELRRAGDAVVVAMKRVPGLADVETSLVSGYPEVQIQYHRDRLARLGIDAASVADLVRRRVQGVRATALREQEKRVDVFVQLVPTDRASIEDLRQINVNPLLVPAIPLDVVADIVPGEGPSEIRRVDQQRAVVVSANLQGFDLQTAITAIEAEVHEVALPPGTEVAVAGQARELQASTNSLWFAFALAVFLVYAVMAVSFENVVQPIVLILAVPLASIGVVATLWLTGFPVSIGVLLGAITLAGVVVANAIVLVDTVNRSLDDGMTPRDAIAHAGTLRLRPIMITSFNSIIGLLPLCYGFGDASEIQQPLALAVMGGSVSSTFLTLLVVPAALVLVTRARAGGDGVTAA